MSLSLTRLAVAPALLAALYVGQAHAADNFTPATGKKLVSACQIDMPRHGKLTPEQGKVVCECVVQAMKTSPDNSGFNEAKWGQLAEVLIKGPAADAKAYPPEVMMTAGFYLAMTQEPGVQACVKARAAKK